MKNNERIVTAAVTQNGMALEHVSAEMKGYDEVVLAAIQYGSKNGWDKDNSKIVLDNWGIAEQMKQSELAKGCWLVSDVGPRTHPSNCQRNVVALFVVQHSEPCRQYAIIYEICYLYHYNCNNFVIHLVLPIYVQVTYQGTPVGIHGMLQVQRCPRLAR